MRAVSRIATALAATAVAAAVIAACTDTVAQKPPKSPLPDYAAAWFATTAPVTAVHRSGDQVYIGFGGDKPGLLVITTRALGLP